MATRTRAPARGAPASFVTRPRRTAARAPPGRRAMRGVGRRWAGWAGCAGEGGKVAGRGRGTNRTASAALRGFVRPRVDMGMLLENGGRKGIGSHGLTDVPLERATAKPRGAPKNAMVEPTQID